MNKFSTLAMLICACLALASGQYAASGYEKQPNILSYDQLPLAAYEQAPIPSSGGYPLSSYAAPSKAVEIIAAGPRYGVSQQLRPVLVDSGYPLAPPTYGQYAQHQKNYAYKPKNYGSRPRYTVVPTGQNHYKSYSAPVEYSKVWLPASDPIVQLYVPENNNGNKNYQPAAPKY